MSASYLEAVEYLMALWSVPHTNKLTRIEKIMAELGNPQCSLLAVHITGTNGKGSTAVMTANILQAAGYKVGLYTSPHVFSWCERMRINGESTSEADFVDLFNQIKAVVDYLVSVDQSLQPSIFEFLTAMGFVYFAREKVDVLVLEVGAGGRLDPTNIIKRSIPVITNVDLDHIDLLGDTKEKIAVEKAGIIKKNSHLITAATDHNVLNILNEKVQETDSQITMVTSADFCNIEVTNDGQKFSFANLKDLEIGFVADYQLLNAGLAIQASHALANFGLDVPEEAIRTGLKRAKWPLRFEICQQNPTIILDGAHNLHAMIALRENLAKMGKKGKWIAVVGISHNRPATEMISQIADLVDLIILTESSYNAQSAAAIDRELKMINCETMVIPNLDTALNKAKQLATELDTIFVFGSLYLAADAKKLLID